MDKHGHPDLCRLDETVLHQTSRPFRFADTSDIRFFDRYWMSGADPEGSGGLITGVAFYKNTGVCDGYFSFQSGDKQYNARFARPLDDDSNSMSVGDLRVTVVDPFERITVSLESGSSPLSAELEWRSVSDVHLEEHHFAAPQGRVLQDITRYDQLGRWSGWVDVGNGRVAVDDWWGARDHSWGVRPGVGGFERAQGDSSMQLQLPTAPRTPMLHVVLFAEVDGRFLGYQYHENAEGRRTGFDAELIEPSGERHRAIDSTIEVDFVEDSRAYREVRIRVEFDGFGIDVVAKPLLHAWAYAGTGYDGGFDDRRGLGAWRGSVSENDIYTYQPPEKVLLNGEVTDSGHREQPVLLTIDGKPGQGHLPVVTRGSLPLRGLA